MELTKLTQALLESVRQDQFCGYDPFDGLNSELFKRLPGHQNEYMRLAWLQLHKRCPVNLRALVGIPKKRNPKGIGLFILGLLEDYARTHDKQCLQDAIELGDWLLTQQSDQRIWRHACWGYHFDWQARAFYVPIGKPNIITTVYVSRALYALGEVTGNARYLDAALDSAYFITQSLHTQQAGQAFFAYIPGETAFVHNASLWGAAWVAWVASKTGNAEMAQLATSIAQQSVNAQNPDGSWVYGTLHHHQFIDGFHTGYNLEALELLQTCLKTGVFKAAIARGYTFYRQNFFEADGAAKYYHQQRYPLDMHSVTQAIFTLVKVGGGAEDFELAQRVIACSIMTMFMPEKGRFCYQKNRWFTNTINYTRWTQAWCYFALAFYNRVLAERS
jgi:polysaccharide biosynthesis protein VpsJ